MHYRARMYDPRVGRFMQTEPLVADRAAEHYRYARNRPLAGTDPEGMQAFPYREEWDRFVGIGVRWTRERGWDIISTFEVRLIDPFPPGDETRIWGFEVTPKGFVTPLAPGRLGWGEFRLLRPEDYWDGAYPVWPSTPQRPARAGKPLPAGLRELLTRIYGPRLRADLIEVVEETPSSVFLQAPFWAGAEALTWGYTIYVRRRLDLNDPSDIALLAHEALHVYQHGGSGSYYPAYLGATALALPWIVAKGWRGHPFEAPAYEFQGKIRRMIFEAYREVPEGHTTLRGEINWRFIEFFERRRDGGRSYLEDLRKLLP
jgi:hypothetical protein